jgi:2'-5' RNA ligase
MRLFVGVNLPSEVRERLAAEQDRLRRAQADVSWVREENIHATLKFLGETEEKRLDRIRSALFEVARGSAAFRIRVSGLGSFGGRVPRVVWVGIQEGAEPLSRLAKDVEAAMARQGFPKEKRGFTAHITLGRVRSARNAESLLAALVQAEAGPFGSVEVNQFELMRSELRPTGSVYTVLAEFPLGETR